MARKSTAKSVARDLARGVWVACFVGVAVGAKNKTKKPSGRRADLTRGVRDCVCSIFMACLVKKMRTKNKNNTRANKKCAIKH